MKKVFYVNNILRFSQARAIRDEVANCGNSVIVDIGCGDGYLVNALDGMYSKYYAVEPSLMHLRIKSDSKVIVINKSFEDMCIEKESVDIVILSSVLQMVENDSSLLSISKDILKEDGKIVLSVPSKYILIERLYNRFPTYIKKLTNLPSTYGDFMLLVNQSYDNAKGFYSPKDLTNLCSGLQLEITRMEYSPGLTISSIYDISLILKLLLGRKISTSRSLLFFSPFIILDTFFFKSRGNELFVVLKKSTTCED